jgi:hypothetical protein
MLNINGLIQKHKLNYILIVKEIAKQMQILHGIFIMRQRIYHPILVNGFYIMKQLNMKIIGFMVKIFFFLFVNKFYLLIILGRTTSNFTATNQLFLNNPEETRWRFEVVYTFENETGLSALDFKINPKPSNVNCSIDPNNGTTDTVFMIKCPEWSMKDHIKDYSLYCMYIKQSS